MVHWSHHYGHHDGKNGGQRKLLSLWYPGDREREMKELGKRYFSIKYPPVANFLQRVTNY
jgi:hypothetical protein